MIPSFLFSRTPAVHFGAGMFGRLDGIIGSLGAKLLLFTGAHSLERTGKKALLELALNNRGIEYSVIPVAGEPSPELVDETVAQHRHSGIDVVCSIGGGSVIDAGKAVSAMLPCGGSVVSYLEGVGNGEKHDGTKVPFIAVPTTAGTGSEATKNAVLSRVGAEGFKKSLRHDNFVPDIVVIDPELMVFCPPDITAATGMDAFTQLLESYVSAKANPVTDALAFCGLELAAENLIPACTEDAENVNVRAGMALAAFLSGVTLANAGLGVVHGLASSIGGLVDIPHGVVCGTLVGAATAVTIETLEKNRSQEEVPLSKYGRIGYMLSGRPCENGDVSGRCALLVRKLDEWTETLRIPRLGEYGVTPELIDPIIDLTENKYNPVPLGRDAIRRIIERRL